MEDSRFKGRVIVISGAGNGIGRAIALDLAKRGASIVVNDYGTNLTGTEGGDPTAAEAVLSEIEAAGGTGCTAMADVGDEAGASSVIAKAIATFGKIDGLVHSACVFPTQCAFDDLPHADFERVVRVSVHGAWNLTQAAWPHFKAQRYGRIVLIQSAAGFFGRSGMPAYGIAKSSFIAFTQYLADEGKAHGILVNNLSPVGWSRAPASEGDKLDYMKTMTPAADLGPVTATLLHPDFAESGLMLHSGGGVVTRMFLAETQGVTFPREQFTPATIAAQMPEITDPQGCRHPRSIEEVGTALFNAIVARDGPFVGADRI